MILVRHVRGRSVLIFGCTMLLAGSVVFAQGHGPGGGGPPSGGDRWADHRVVVFLVLKGALVAKADPSAKGPTSGVAHAQWGRTPQVRNRQCRAGCDLVLRSGGGTTRSSPKALVFGLSRRRRWTISSTPTRGPSCFVISRSCRNSHGWSNCPNRPCPTRPAYSR